MHHGIEVMLGEAHGRYLEAEEASLLTSWALDMPRRLEVMMALARVEDQIVERTLEDLYERDPELLDRMPQAMSKGPRDLRLVLRHCAMAQLRGELRFLDEELLRWLRPILHGFMEAELVGYTFERLRAHALEALCPEVADRLDSYLSRVHAMLR